MSDLLSIQPQNGFRPTMGPPERPNSKLRSQAEPRPVWRDRVCRVGSVVFNGALVLTPNNSKYFYEIQDHFAAGPNLMQGYGINV